MCSGAVVLPLMCNCELSLACYILPAPCVEESYETAGNSAGLYICVICPVTRLEVSVHYCVVLCEVRIVRNIVWSSRFYTVFTLVTYYRTVWLVQYSTGTMVTMNWYCTELFHLVI